MEAWVQICIQSPASWGEGEAEEGKEGEEGVGEGEESGEEGEKEEGGRNHHPLSSYNVPANVLNLPHLILEITLLGIIITISQMGQSRLTEVE